MRNILILAALTACNTDATTGDIPEQLETLEVTISGPGASEYEALHALGGITVTGEGQDFSMAISSGAAELVLDVHSPGASDLSTLDASDGTIDVFESSFEGSRSFVVADDSGTVYFANAGDAGAEADALFGEGFASFGDEVGSTEDESFEWSYRYIDFQTDDGAVSLLPGEVETITVGGVDYRVAAIAAYDREPVEDAALPACPVLTDMLSYELLRLEATAEADFLTRPDGIPAAALGCL